VAVAVVAAVVWARRRHARRVATCLLVAGFVGMVLETVLLLRYQMSNGVVYQHVGWLLTCFMTGMAAGSYAAGGIRPHRSVSGRIAQRFSTSLAAWAGAGIPAASGCRHQRAARGRRRPVGGLRPARPS
jgi:hypothetical protein